MVQLKVRALQLLKYRLSLVLEHLELGYPLNRIKELKKTSIDNLLISNRSLLKYIEYIINEVNAF